MRYVILPTLIVLAGCADAAPTSTDEHAAHARVAGTLSSPATASVSAPIQVFSTTLRAENEPNDASDSEAKGHALVTVREDGTIEFDLVINNKGDETFHQAHIHKGVVGVNGPIHWDFLQSGVPVASISGHPGILRGVARARAAAVLSDLLANPHLYYVNVHTPQLPLGAIRGQLP
jgi:CHRD domain-containing protein